MSYAKLVGVADLQDGYPNTITAGISAQLYNQLGEKWLDDISWYQLPIIT